METRRKSRPPAGCSRFRLAYKEHAMPNKIVTDLIVAVAKLQEDMKLIKWALSILLGGITTLLIEVTKVLLGAK